MSSAYAYAEDGGKAPDELVLKWKVDEYGVQAVFGRTLSFHEIRMMDLAHNIYNAYYERKISDNWVEWAEKNPQKAAILNAAMLLYEAELDG